MDQVPALGTLLQERYRITRVIATDSLGAVYQVIDTKITEQSYVAREFCPPPQGKEEREKTENQFLKTAELLKSFEHPHLIHVFNAFIEANRYYLITEEVEGLSLQALFGLTSTPITENEALNWLIQVCEALDYLHHVSPPFYMKSLSPSVLDVDRDGNLKAGGFALHILFSKAEDFESKFVAPEMEEGASGSAAADIYSMAASFYFLLTRQIAGPSPAPLKQLNPDVSEKTNRLILTCLQADPSKRPQDAGKLAADFDEILHPLQQDIPTVSAPKPSILSRLVVKTVENAVVGIAALWERPYLIVLMALLVWVAMVYLRPQHAKHYHKTGPVLYVASRHWVAAVNPTSLQTLDYIPEIQQTFAIVTASETPDVWAATHEGVLFRIKPEDNSVAYRFSVKQPIGGIACASKNLLFVALDRDNELGVYSTDTGKPIALSPVGQLPKDVAYNPRQGEIYLTTGNLKALSILDTDKFLPKRTYYLDAVPDQMKQSSDGNYIYLGYNSTSRLNIFDASTKRVVTTIPLPVSGPYLLSAYDGGILVTATKSNTLLMYESPSGTLKVQTYFNKPRAALYASSINKIFVLSANGYLYVIDPATGKPVSHEKVGTLPSALLLVP